MIHNTTEAESLSALEHIRQQQSMEIGRLQQLQQQQQLQMEQQQLQIQDQQVELQRRQERQQSLEAQVRRFRMLQDHDAEVFVEQSQAIDYWQLQFHQLERNSRVLLTQLNREAYDVEMEAEFD
ncbi:serum response factor homolog A-like [Microplitis demolitor]|uniref:serum response factor homolog A-like n=1 Tax=Microplitis demolitor TaxID=69319 RepID=UPI00235B6890|nr:serum response factor homolog A-like [Microplitis demolitor]